MSSSLSSLGTRDDSYWKNSVQNRLALGLLDVVEPSRRRRQLRSGGGSIADVVAAWSSRRLQFASRAVSHSVMRCVLVSSSIWKNAFLFSSLITSEIRRTGRFSWLRPLGPGWLVSGILSVASFAAWDGITTLAFLVVSDLGFGFFRLLPLTLFTVIDVAAFPAALLFLIRRFIGISSESDEFFSQSIYSTGICVKGRHMEFLDVIVEL